MIGYSDAVKQNGKDFTNIEDTIQKAWSGIGFKNFREQVAKKHSNVAHLCADCWYEQCVKHLSKPRKKQKTG
jgi:uncharacterized protein YukE